MNDVTKSFADLKRSAGQQPPTRRMRPRYRFRAAVRQAINNLDWLSEPEEDAAAGGKAKMNLIMLRGKSKALKSTLTVHEKSLLMKPVDHRTEGDREKLFKAMLALGNFRRNRYPEAMQRQLAENTHFSSYGPGRVIVRQGHVPEALYWLVEGEVAVSVTSEHPATHKLIHKIVGKMAAGDMFGEVGLLHRKPRTATITTETNCSLLWLRRDDFEIIIRAHLASKWDEVTQAMRSLPYFDKWEENAIQESCILSKMLSFNKDEVILGDALGHPNCVYFVITGECRLIEALQVVATTSADVVRSKQCPRRSYRLYEEGGSRRPGDSVETHFLQVCRMRAGSCFNLGERLGARTVVAVSAVVTCMICPRYFILQNSNANIWNRIVAYLDASVPTTAELFRDFRQERHWLCHKQGMVREIVARKKGGTTKTTVHDVPYSLRMNTVYPPDRPGLVPKSTARLLRFSVVLGDAERTLGRQPRRSSVARSSIARGSIVGDPTGRNSIASTQMGRNSIASTQMGRNSIAGTQMGRNSIAGTQMGRNSIASTHMGRNSSSSPLTGKDAIMGRPNARKSIVASSVGRKSIAGDFIARKSIVAGLLGKTSFSL